MPKTGRAKARHHASALSCRGLTKSFGSLQVLGGVDLTVPTGTTFGLLGPNGSGKTTLLRVLLGLVEPDGGEGSVLGCPLPPRPVLGRIGYMPQRLAVYPDLTVGQNLALLGRLGGLEEGAIAARTDEVLVVVDLAHRRDDPVSELSGGMQRRTSLAGALLTAPDLLVLDEPTVGVDPELRATFWDHFRDLTAKGRTVVITTHYLDEASRCDQVAYLHGGRILFTGSPAAVRDRTGASNLEDAFLALVRAQRATAEVVP